MSDPEYDAELEDAGRRPVPDFEEGASPLAPRALAALFFRPREFFSGRWALDRFPFHLIAAWFLGAAGAVNRIDSSLLKAEMSRPRAGWDQIAPHVVGSWPGFWLWILAVGLFGGLVAWWVHGWVFRLFLRLAGAIEPDRRAARLVMVYGALAFSGPAVLLPLVYTALYRSYGDAFHAAPLWSMLILVFPFWMIWVTYSGVRTVFNPPVWKTRIWFAILPAILMTLVIGIVPAAVVLLLGPGG